MFDRLIRFAARHVPHHLALSSGTGHVSYAQLDRAVDQVGAALTRDGVGEGAVVGVAIGDAYVHALVTLAAARLGAATTSLFGPMAQALARLTGVTVLVADAPAVGARITADRDWLEAALAADAPPLPRLALDRGALGRVQLSSGSTGVPKAAELSWGLLETRIANSVATGGALARTLSLIGPESGALQLWLGTWRARGTVLVAPAQLGAITAALPMLAPTMILAAPAQLTALLEALPADATPLAGGPTLVITGGHAARAVRERAAVRLGVAVATAYMSTEAGLAAMGYAARLPSADAVGYVAPAIEVEIVDEAGAVCPPGAAGLIRLRGPEVVAGYRDGPGAAFRDGWFYPGDVGSLDTDGCLRVAGRADELLNIGGEKVAPEALEELARAVPGIADVAAFALSGEAGDQPWLAIVRDAAVEEAAIAERLGGALTLPGLGTVKIAWIDAIPRTPMGKVRREELQAAARRL